MVIETAVRRFRRQRRYGRLGGKSTASKAGWARATSAGPAQASTVHECGAELSEGPLTTTARRTAVDL